MSDQTDLASVLAGVTQLLSRLSGVIGSNSNFIAGTLTDPSSFNSTGGTTGDLGYYPMQLIDGTTGYVPCLARITALIALAGTGGAAANAAATLANTAAALANTNAAAAQAVVDGQAAMLAQMSAQLSAVTAADRTQTGADRAQTGADRVQTGKDVVTTGASVTAAAGSAASASTAAGVATTGAAIKALLATTILAGGTMPVEVVGISGGIGTGAGGTDGTYAGGVSGGPPGFQWTYTISGGKLASYAILTPGIATSNAVPTLSLPSGGFTTQPTVPTATVSTIPVGRQFHAPSADGTQLLAWGNNAGVVASAPFGAPQVGLLIGASTAPLVPTFATQGQNPVTDGGGIAGPFTAIHGTPVQTTGNLRWVSVFAGPAGIYKLQIFTRSGLSFTLVSTQDVALVPGANMITGLAIPVTAGVHYVAFEAPTSSLSLRTAAQGNADYYGGSAVTTTVGNSITLTRYATGQFCMGFAIEPVYASTLAQRVALDDQDAADAIASAYGQTATSGTDLTLSSVNAGANYTYIDGAPIAFSGRLKTLNAKVSGAGEYTFFLFTKAGAVFTPVAKFVATLADGLNYLDVSARRIKVLAGVHYIGLASATSSQNKQYRTPGGGMWYLSGAPDWSGSTFTANATYSIMVSATVALDTVALNTGKLTTLAGQVATAATTSASGALSGFDRIALLTGTAWNAMVIYGQSLAEGYNSAVQTTTAPYPGHKTFGGGLRSGKPGNVAGAVNTSPGTTSVKTLVEDNVSPSAANYSGCGETIGTVMAAELSTRAARENGLAPAKCVQFVSCAAHGAYSLAQLTKGATWYNQLTDHISEGMARAVAAGVDYQLGLVPYIQGEADADANTARVTYLAGLRAMRAAMEADYWTLSAAAGGSVIAKSNPLHMLLTQTSTWGSGGNGVTLSSIEQIALAQADADRLDPRIHLIGPGYPFARNSSDKVHLTGPEERRLGRYFGRAAKQLLVEGRIPDAFRFRTAYASGTTLTIICDTPGSAVLFDTTSLAAATNNGIVVQDDTGALTLSNISIGQSVAATAAAAPRYLTPITITLNRALGANPKFRYALDQNGSSTIGLAGFWGNIRDNTADSFTAGGVTYPMPHWAPHAQLDIGVLEAMS